MTMQGKQAWAIRTRNSITGEVDVETYPSRRKAISAMAACDAHLGGSLISYRLGQVQDGEWIDEGGDGESDEEASR